MGSGKINVYSYRAEDKVLNLYRSDLEALDRHFKETSVSLVNSLVMSYRLSRLSTFEKGIVYHFTQLLKSCKICLN
jgi:hypothetical protein